MSVRFSLDGESFELSPELVRAWLDRQSLRTSAGTEIDGVRWPVKQVIALLREPSRPVSNGRTPAAGVIQGCDLISTVSGSSV